MTIEGLFSSLSRAIKKKLSKLFNRKKQTEDKPEIPKTWKKRKHTSPAAGPRVADPGSAESMTRKVYRVPLIKTMKRLLAGILLFINFCISQFLLASGTDAAPAFIFFLLNSLILLDYLWKTRTKEGEKT